MARFAQYAMVASEEALSDAGWSPKGDLDLEATGRLLNLAHESTLIRIRACIWAQVSEVWTTYMTPPLLSKKG
jgi:hypothetical protein